MSHGDRARAPSPVGDRRQLAVAKWQFRAADASVRSVWRRLPKRERPAEGAFAATAQLLDLSADHD